MSARQRRLVLLILCAALTAALPATHASAQVPSVLGYWREPGGSIIRIAPCGQRLCIAIVRLAGGNHPAHDTHNPTPELRNRALCGLQIGTDFTEIDPQHARDGHLYDPRSGHTYSGEMTAEGNLLHLRGYLGLRILGRTQTWVRATRPPPCQ